MEEELEQTKPLPYLSEDALTYLEQNKDLQESGYGRSVWF